MPAGWFQPNNQCPMRTAPDAGTRRPAGDKLFLSDYRTEPAALTNQTPHLPFFRLAALAGCLAIGLPLDLAAQDETPNRTSFTLDARARVEQANQDNPLEDATAPTVRVRAGVSTPSWSGLSAFAELEAIEAIGDDFNSGSNGRTQYSPILDPEDVELNQLSLRYLNGPHYVQIGRQSMVLDNARFFGDEPYRQNQQTFDALTYMNTALEGQQFRYVYMVRARRYLSDEHPVGEIDMDTHLFSYRLQRLNGDVFSAYAHLIDMNTAAVAQNSTKTFGLRYSGSVPVASSELLYSVEFASQADYGDGASSNDADYWAAELGIKFNNEWVAKLGQERLGGDGVYGFQTPFASNHSFHGLADLFALRTPATGLVDTYAKLTVPLLGARVSLAAHSFGADQGSADHGSEFDLHIERRFAQRFAVNLMIADYHADSFSVDTLRWSLGLDFSY